MATPDPGRNVEPQVRHGHAGIWFGLLACTALAVAAFRFADVGRFLAMLREAQPLWLLGAVLLQISTYFWLALGWGDVLRHAGARQPLGRLLPIALVELFADQAIPSAGMGGNVVLVARLAAAGAPRGTAVATLLVSMIGYYLAYAVLAVSALLLLWLHGIVTPLLAGLVSALLLVTLAVPSLALWLRRSGARCLPGWVERIPLVRSLIETMGEAPPELVSDRSLILRVAGWSGLVFLTDAATLAICLCALGEPLLPATSFLAMMLASIVATLGPIPMGLGSFEATSTAMLAMLGVPVEVALSATLLLRGFTLWLPLLPGFVLLRRHAA